MKKILVANRGEIALRIIRTCQRLGVKTVAVYTIHDCDAPYVDAADQAVQLVSEDTITPYMDSHQLLDIASNYQVDAIHPGYGFLSENADFARTVEAAEISWIGPAAESIAAMADKIQARAVAEQEGIPVLPAVNLGLKQDLAAINIHITPETPVLIKASAGGGGMGMREVRDAADLGIAIDKARSQALRLFGSGDLILERLVESGRHIEVQIAGDKHGHAIHLLERDCSAQRRRQKLLEEAPAPGLDSALRSRLHDAALKLAAAVNYHNVGTVEFLVEGNNFFFLEMNTRLQVEHPVTEAILNLDLVEMQIDIARGLPLALSQEDIVAEGHAIEARVYAEAPELDFQPQTGVLAALEFAEDDSARVDSGVAPGNKISPHYDGLLCKIIAHAADRETATGKLIDALKSMRLSGVASNQHFLQSVLASDLWTNLLNTRTVEQEFSTLLSGSIPQGDALQQILVAATIWNFQVNPSAADQVFWPGSRYIARQAHWQLGADRWSVPWCWTGPNQFEFPTWGWSAECTQTSTGEPSLIIEVQQQRQTFHFYQDRQQLWVWSALLGNTALELHNDANQAALSGSSGDCRSHGPGQIISVAVAPGDIVSQGDPLIILESMKMESTLVAAVSGRVEAVTVAPGELISSNQLLVKLSLPEDTT